MLSDEYPNGLLAVSQRRIGDKHIARAIVYPNPKDMTKTLVLARAVSEKNAMDALEGLFYELDEIMA